MTFSNKKASKVIIYIYFVNKIVRKKAWKRETQFFTNRAVKKKGDRTPF